MADTSSAGKLLFPDSDSTTLLSTFCLQKNKKIVATHENKSSQNNNVVSDCGTIYKLMTGSFKKLTDTMTD